MNVGVFVGILLRMLMFCWLSLEMMMVIVEIMSMMRVYGMVCRKVCLVRSMVMEYIEISMD